MRDLKRHAGVTVVIDDGHERRLASDYAYYPPVPGALALDWSGAKTQVRTGWEWSVLGLNPSLVHKRAPGSRPTILVAMGGSDPHGLTCAWARRWRCSTAPIRVRFMVGTGTKDANAVARGLCHEAEL